MGRPSSSSGLLLPRDTALAAVVPRTPDRRSARRATDQRRPTGLRSLRPSAWTPNHELVRRRRRACRRARRRTVRRGRMVGWGQVRCRLRRSDTGAIDRSRSRQRLPRRSLRELPGGYDALAPEDRQTAHLAEGDPAAAVETVAARKASGDTFCASARSRSWTVAHLRRATAGSSPTRPGRGPGSPRSPSPSGKARSATRSRDVAALLPWGFSLADIEIPVLLFHGEQDAGQPREHLDFWIRTIRCAEVRVWPDAGHQGISRHWREVLESVAPKGPCRRLDGRASRALPSSVVGTRHSANQTPVRAPAFGL